MLIAYRWQALDAHGEPLTGILHCQRYSLAQQALVDQKLYPIKLQRYYLTHHALKRLLFKLIQQLSPLLDAKLDLQAALGIITAAETHALTQAYFSQLKQDVQRGQSLSGSLQELAHHRCQSECAFIQAGEETGQLTQSLQHLLMLMKNKRSLQTQLKNSLRYPLFLFAMTILMSGGILTWVIPAYQDFFASMGSSLPRLTQIILTLSHRCAQPSIAGLMACLLGLALVAWSTQQPMLAQALEDLRLKLSWIGRLLIDNQLSQWSYLMATALNTHLPVLTALHIANLGIRYHSVKSRFTQLTQELAHGNTFSDSLRSLSLFDEQSLQLVFIGENSARMGELLSEVAKHYQQNLHERLTRLARRAEPIAIFLLAAITGLIITALYLPMVNLGLTLS